MLRKKKPESLDLKFYRIWIKSSGAVFSVSRSIERLLSCTWLACPMTFCTLWWGMGYGEARLRMRAKFQILDFLGLESPEFR